MKRGMKILGTSLLLGALTALGGCVYPPAYYQRTGVVYSDDGQYGRGNAAVDANDDDGYYYAPDYYAPGYYDNPWWGYGPYFGLGLGFYGGGYCCGHHHRGPWRHGYDGGHGGHSGYGGRGGYGAHGGAHSGSAGHGGGGHH